MGNIRRGVGVLNSKSRIFLYHLSDELPPLFRSFVDSLQEEDPLAPVTVVVPSWYAGFSLRHELGRSGLANVRFITSYRLSDLLGAPSRDRAKKEAADADYRRRLDSSSPRTSIWSAGAG